jgi:hypothetical protein
MLTYADVCSEILKLPKALPHRNTIFVAHRLPYRHFVKV